jgi:hypothetical protein
VSIAAVGKLSLQPGCKGYSVSAILYTDNVKQSNETLKKGDIMSQVSLLHDCCEELGVTINLSLLSLEIPHKNITSHLDDLRYTSRKVSELEKHIKQQEEADYQVIKHHTYSIFAYFVVSVICIYLMYKLLRCIMLYCNVTVCTRLCKEVRDTLYSSPDLGLLPRSYSEY